MHDFIYFRFGIWSLCSIQTLNRFNGILQMKNPMHMKNAKYGINTVTAGRVWSANILRVLRKFIRTLVQLCVDHAIFNF